MEMESTEVVLFVLMLFSFVTELLQPEPEPTKPSTQIRSRHPSNAIIAKLVQHQRRLKSLKKRIGRRKARSMADDDERFQALRTAMICEYYGTRRVPRSLWVNNRTSATLMCRGSKFSECPSTLSNTSVVAWKQRWGEATPTSGSVSLCLKKIAIALWKLATNSEYRTISLVWSRQIYGLLLCARVLLLCCEPTPS
ncbi:hypothetical protein JOQ06_011458 [Pogonophryne albipinna]|uniref:Uncharacterized protein n=1 Tax=Pogonophryne albipinna TaxID=1090488 RepID=A0AAD6BBF1_9TELE|nr:hypothetical protein JOQ06_011458 [Pogonophryne albipinna]